MRHITTHPFRTYFLRIQDDRFSLVYGTCMSELWVILGHDFSSLRRSGRFCLTSLLDVSAVLDSSYDNLYFVEVDMLYRFEFRSGIFLFPSFFRVFYFALRACLTNSNTKTKTKKIRAVIGPQE